MKAVRYYGIKEVKAKEIEKPACKEDEVLIKVEYAGICGSDLHIYNQGMFVLNIPETMGHEFTGIIEAVGSKVMNYNIGDAVIANPMVPCGECPSCRKGSYNTCENLSFIGECRQGCFAEYIVIEESKLIKINHPDNLKKFVLCEPLGVAVHICKMAEFKPEDKIVIMGAGPIGLLILALAKSIYHVSEVSVVDLSKERLAMATKAGADFCYTDGNAIGYSYNKIVDAAGVPQTVQLAVNHLDTNGSLYIVSIFEQDTGIDANAIVSKQLRIIGCNVYDNEDLEMAVSLLETNQLEVEFLITHEFSLEDCKKAFDLLSGGLKTASKVIFLPSKK